MDATDPGHRQPAANLPRYPSLSLIVVLHFESGGPGSRGERRGSPAPGEEREVCQASDE